MQYNETFYLNLNVYVFAEKITEKKIIRRKNCHLFTILMNKGQNSFYRVTVWTAYIEAIADVVVQAFDFMINWKAAV